MLRRTLEKLSPPQRPLRPSHDVYITVGFYVLTHGPKHRRGLIGYDGPLASSGRGSKPRPPYVSYIRQSVRMYSKVTFPKSVLLLKTKKYRESLCQTTAATPQERLAARELPTANGLARDEGHSCLRRSTGILALTARIRSCCW